MNSTIMPTLRYRDAEAAMAWLCKAFGFTEHLAARDGEGHLVHAELVLGGGMVGPNAGELIAEVALAIEMGSDATDIGLTIHPHPTLSETVNFAAEAFEGTLTDLYLPKRK